LSTVFRTGRSTDPADKLGLTALLTAVWDEGTSRRTAEQISDELAGIGASLSIAADSDSSSARLYSLKRHLPKALDVYADVLRNPTFPDAELEREKNKALARLVQVRDDPNSLAQLAMAASLYGPNHPYGQSPYGTPSTIPSITRLDLEDCYRIHARPEQATLIAVGDTTVAELVPQLEKVFASWKSSAAPAAAKLPTLPAAKPTRIVLIDKPGSAQSVIVVSQIGVLRNTPDYYALTVMNSIFGGQFSSRLNMNLREDKGYTYGARTMFDWRTRQPGPFLAMASVQTAVTSPALVEFLKEFDGIVKARPVTTEELDFSKAYLTRGYTAEFETPDQLARQVETLVEHRLPDDYFTTYVPRIDAVSAQDVLQVAGKHLDLGHLTIVIVADRLKVEDSLRKLPTGKDLQTLQFDANFRLVPAKPASSAQPLPSQHERS
jgi:zinc protease